MLMLMLWCYYELAWIWFKWMRMWLGHDYCDYTCVNDINSAYMVDEVMWKCVACNESMFVAETMLPAAS
jgi:hypothetical protein